ncbi:hypothetical protein Pfo_019564 [Paulownia fortunei]|nr:hypothetical protein Pfo_019564 [Paulownia fortunei]
MIFGFSNFLSWSIFMAEESIDPLVTPEKNAAGNLGYLNNGRGTHAHHRRASIGSNHEGDNARRYFSEKTDSANSSQNTIPHYLRASTGSCHDICKYGRRHAFEEKPREPLRKRTAKPSPNELNFVEMTVSGKQKKEKVVNHEPSADTKKHSQLVKTSPDTKSYSPKLKASLDAKTYSPRQNASCRNKTHLPNSPTKKSTSSDSPEIIKMEILLPSKEVEVLVKEGNSIDNKISRTDKKSFDQSVKRSFSVKSKPIKVKPSSASDNPYGIHGRGRRNSDVQTGRKMTASTMSAKKALESPAAPLSPKYSLSKTASSKARKAGRLKLLSPLKDQNRIHQVGTERSYTEDSEKTFHVIKTGTETNALDSVPDDHAISAQPSTSSLLSLSHANSPSSLSHEEDEEIKYCGNEADEFVSDNTVSMEIGKVQPVKESHNKTLGTETENDAFESIPDDHAIPALPSRSSPKSLSHAKSPSSLSHEEEDDDEIQYSGNEADEFVTDDTVSIEIGNIQSVKENHDKTLRMGTQNNALESIPDDHVISALPNPSSPKSLSQAKSPSSLSHEEDDEAIKRSGIVADEFVSDNTISTEIGKVQRLTENHKTQRKSRVVLSEDKYYSPVKLKFRRGKVVDLQPDNIIPRRLKFRRARVSGDKADGFISDNKKPMEIGTVQPVKENHNRTLRKSRMVVSEDKYRSPVKLFRSEKVVDLQSDNNSPRRLRLGRARVPGAEDGKGDLRRRTIKKAGGKNDANGAEFSSRKVILKHQDVQGKKDAQGLFNNVIEETASKLVESRKSKVKALVGAFETVISLQERQPSLHTVS